MNVVDRVKQTGTAVDTAGGTYNIQLYGGAAEAGYVGFHEAYFQYDFGAGFTVAREIMAIPVLLENGAEWLLTTAWLELVSGTSVIAHVDMTTTHPIQKSASWAFTTGVSVKISVVLTAATIGGIQSKYSNLGPSGNVRDTLRNRVDEAAYPARMGIGGGAVAIGKGKATGLDAIVIGSHDELNGATGRRSISIGSTLISGVGQIALGHVNSTYNENSFTRGQNGYEITTGIITNHQRTDGMLQAYTVDATPTIAQTRDETGTAVTNGEWIYLDPGVSHFKVVVLATDKDTYDSKVIELSFSAKNTDTYDAAALIGSLTKTTAASDAGTASWDVGLVFDAPNGWFKFEVTGEAARNIIWTVSYDQHNSTFWV